MIKGKGGKSIMNFWLMAAAALSMIMLLTHIPAQAAGTDPCAKYSNTRDSDNDGFSDYDECKGITFAGPGGQGLPSTFPGSSMSATVPRTNRLDPNSKDLFVVVVPAAGGYFSLLPDRLEYVYIGKAYGGLEIAAHEIDYRQASADRTVSNTCTIPTGQTIRQKAVKISENLDPGSGTSALILASSSSQHGTPNGTDLATIYTLRIKNHIQSVCGCSDMATCSPCCDNAQVCGMNFFYKYIKHTIAHEIAHNLMLTTKSDRKWGWHYAEGTGVDMDYQVTYSGTIFKLGTIFTTADQSGAILK